ncbi:hypothetical protein QQ045_007735 [Rhodiola kirilowii]
MNSAIIALIPKSKTTSEPGDYRPIACCNVAYKVIPGLLAERLKVVLHGIIDKAQGAFVKDRSIVGNVCLAQQIVSGYSRKNISERMAWKIDLRKAYDSVEWQFIHDMLILFKFPLKFISWINMILKGMNKTHGYYHHPKCHRVDLKHLIFADDLFLFSSGRCSSIAALKDSLESFLLLTLTKVSYSWPGLAIVFYWARICLLPKKVLKAVNSICANFLWSGKSTGRGCHLLDWSSVCSGKKEGGLGIKNLDIMNDAMVMNQLWDLNKNNLNVWSEWIKAYWTKGTHWWENDHLIQSSWVLRRLAYCKRFSVKCTDVVNGRLVWIGEGEGFTVHDTYQTLITRRGEVDWHKLVWKRFNTPRASVNAVLVARDRILTKSRMRSMTMVYERGSDLCAL